jgi:hypothetical protein
MANFLATDLDHPAGIIKHRHKAIQHHPDMIDGCPTATGLSINTTPASTNQPWLVGAVDNVRPAVVAAAASAASVCGQLRYPCRPLSPRC